METDYPEIYINADNYHVDVKAAQTELLNAQYEFTRHPSATNWAQVEQAMFDYQHVKLNAKVDNGGRAAIAFNN